MRGRNCRGALLLWVAVQAWAGAAQAVVISAGMAAGAPGDVVAVDVSLATQGAAVLATQNRIDFGRQAYIAARPNGAPDCAVNPAIDKGATGFRFLPLGCDPTADCASVRVFVIAFDNLAPIADGSRLYTCQVRIAADAAAGIHPLALAELGASAAGGVSLPTSGVDGAVTVLSPPVARVVLGSAAGQPGDVVQVGGTLTLLDATAAIAGVSLDFAFDPLTRVRSTQSGTPDCATAMPSNASFAFQPVDCTPDLDCSGVRALVWTLAGATAPFVDGAALFDCAVGIDDAAAAGAYPLVAGPALGSDPDGQPLALIGVDGVITVEAPLPPACAGDCDGSGQVSINELLLGVNILIGNASPEQCRAVDTNGDGRVAVNELVQAVNAALGSCPI